LDGGKVSEKLSERKSISKKDGKGIGSVKPDGAIGPGVNAGTDQELQSSCILVSHMNTILKILPGATRLNLCIRYVKECDICELRILLVQQM
jgi:hypothetical protein